MMRKNIILWICFILAISFMAAQEKEESIHKPLVDLDDDLFAPNHSYRGADWRGKDDNDIDSGTRPGVYDDASGLIDNNCNGIHGWPTWGDKSYEDQFCKNSAARGIVIFGDSAAAAFHIPKKVILEAGLTLKYLELLFPTAQNEFDWPHKSWATGFLPEIEGESIYLKMRDRNRCNHRDYQNVAVNGAKAVSFVGQVEDFSRASSDKPVLAFMAYIGNDICKKSLDQMTTPEDFRKNILAGLEAFDKKVPAGSKLLMIGLADGRILYQTMHNQPHPLGITYADLYVFLTSIGGNPCQTWLTADADSREKATQRAKELSSILKEIAQTQKYQNFELAYMDLPLQKIMDVWASQGGHLPDLIEAVDGFHPSHAFHRLMSKMVWEELSTKYPSFIGPVNPYNAQIQKIFGEQGGH